ncbi:MAG: ABC transporter substrate-binding protein [Lactobacillus helveticus]|uniref:ABC transporter substrate-binding protein n=3 Tax=Lactobacillus helveticus TaxID=1587 RepID=A0AAU8XUQ5_LACHE|nr:nucleoside hydrolase [Lactobacillus helveticus]ABX27029.1 Nucleoside hydrolase [Lactobacillus helveticus DPC 4571]AUI74472.1 ABC transporter substrate-binding protein [Lactobacillus helveticus]AUI76424.1 ABC transporter substrate-binding protein [Lactobacillus helveticus]AZA20071.1 MAG: ABC transporter substrate-binding protein [Lactobacillus helveticus]MDY0991976.1 nucleoside hydrolase [Lactobacillus helveticus]
MKQTYFNHDGNIDDLVSYLLLLQAPDIKLLGVGAIDADGFIDPSVAACRKMTDLFNLRGDELAVARSNSRAVNQFPHDWRMATYSFNYLPILNEKGSVDTPQAELPAHLDMVEKLKHAKEPVTLIMTGPLTDLARALDVDPDIEQHIKKLYWMGGSLDGHGNVAMVNADGSQEWNSFWDPYAVKRVFDSNIPIQMVGLESTEEIPLNDELRRHWASLHKYPAMDLIGQGYSLIISIPSAELYLWDVLTTVSALYPEVVETEKAKATVITDGMSAGSFRRDPNGREVDIVIKANKELFFQKMDEILERTK